ncbi:MAG TPA: glycosyltransferase family 2 protein [Flavobacterium sp.]|uniref:glycosyltransferase family 2 protein n=1 Tax=Flavobacterium sp. TaxID=239 RepID=UPI002DBEEE74|nr:glycosyltransferase family 2 protein [Flavobacterium sp.]HEU4790434.1 glycosyltransferase family 2 protein [Flavobacterium sp.]
MLAIIIPYFKLTFFEATLQSLASQTCQRFKVYIGDDASPDNPNNLLEKYKGQFDFVYHRFENNLGKTSLTQQWERCIALSGNEEWIMTLGDDDVLGENVVEEFCENISEIKSEGINVVRFSTQIIDEKGNTISGIYQHPIKEKTTDFLIKKFSKQTRSSFSEYVFNKKVLVEKSFRNFPLAWHSDDMAFLEFSNFENCFSINESIIYVRVSTLNITGDSTFNDIKNKATFEFCAILFDVYSKMFSNEQKKIILQKLEKAFLNIPSIENYRVLFYYYCKQLGLMETIYFQIHMFRVGIILILKKVKLFHFVQSFHSKIINK